MQDLAQTIGLAITQGITEFLPISSSAHLLLFSKIFGFADQTLAIDVAVHAGSLPAVLLYFRKQIASLIGGAWHVVRHPLTPHPEKSLILFLIIASLPLIPVGLLLSGFGLGLAEGLLRLPIITAIATIGFALLLYYAEKRSRTMQVQDSNSQLSWKTALFVGFMQCFALIPGTSRSGVVTTACLMLGMPNKQALQIAMLLSIPAIIAATSLTTLKLISIGDSAINSTAIIAAIAAFICAYASIALIMKFINRIGFLPFVIYRLIMGVAILGFLVI